MAEEGDSKSDLEKIEERRRQMLRDKPLVSRPVWLMRRLVVFVVWLGGLALALALGNGIAIIVGLVIFALSMPIVGEVVTDLSYSEYRWEWEVVNGIGQESGDSKDGG